MKLHTYGRLRNSFRPSQEIRKMRTYWRQRNDLVQAIPQIVEKIQNPKEKIEAVESSAVLRRQTFHSLLEPDMIFRRENLFHCNLLNSIGSRQLWKDKIELVSWLLTERLVSTNRLFIGRLRSTG